MFGPDIEDLGQIIGVLLEKQGKCLFFRELIRIFAADLCRRGSDKWATR